MLPVHQEKLDRHDGGCTCGAHTLGRSLCGLHRDAFLAKALSSIETIKFVADGVVSLEHYYRYGIYSGVTQRGAPGEHVAQRQPMRVHFVVIQRARVLLGPSVEDARVVRRAGQAR